MANGSIIIDLLMKTGEFSTDTKRAEKSLSDLEKQAKKSAAAFKASFAGNLAANAVEKLTSAVSELPNKVLEAVDAFNDVKDATGASIENISALDRIARETGGTIEVVETSLIKLNQVLEKSKAGSDAANALKAIGLNAAELKKEDPAEALLKIATALSGFEDNANKARLTQILFGKSLKEVAPFLNDLAEKGKLVSTVTEEQAKHVEEYRKRTFALKADIEDLARTIGLNLITKLDDLRQRYLETFKGAPKTSDHIKDELDRVTQTTGLLEEKLADLQKPGFNFERPFTNLDTLKSSLKKYQDLRDQLTKQFTDTRDKEVDDATKPDVKPDIGVLPNTKDDASKARVENFIKSIEAATKETQSAQESALKSLDRAYSENLLSIEDYYDQRREATQEFTAFASSQYDAEIRALERLRKQQEKQTEKEGTTGKISDLKEKQRDLTFKNTEAIKELNSEQSKATEKYKADLIGLNASLEELQGNLGKAAALRFDLQNSSLSRRANVQGDQGTADAIAKLRAFQIAQADTNKITEDSGRITDELKNKEDRLAISQSLGAETELSALLKVGQARRAAVQQMEAMVLAQEAIAKASENPQLILNAEKSRVALEQLKASADVLDDKFKSIFSGAAGDAFGDFVTGTKTASEAFKSFASTVISQLARIAAQELVNAAIGKSSGLFGGFGSLFGGGKSGSAASTVGGPSSTSGWLDFSNIGLTPTEFAVGTNFIPHDNFPAILHKGESVVPAKYNPAAGGSSGMGGSNITNFNVAAGVTRNELVTSLQLLTKSLRSEFDKKIRDKGIA